MFPYTRYPIPHARVQNVLGRQPVIETKFYGPIEYQPAVGGGMDKLSVSCNDLATDHVLFKIDQTAMMGKEE